MGTHLWSLKSNLQKLTRQILKNGTKRQASGHGPNQETRRQEKVFRQPALRKTSQELRRRSRYPAKTRFDPIRSMANLHQAPEATICSPGSIEGPTFHQPVHPNLGQTNRHPIVQIGRQVRPREQNREKTTTRSPSQSTS